MEIETQIESGIAKIVLNRPEVFNSFNRTMALQMQDALANCDKDPLVRAVLITGNGKAFCAGQDLSEAIDPKGPGLKQIVDLHYNPIIRAICKMEKPVIAAVNGVAAGAGANIALACDIVIAKESASFIQAFSKIGLIPDSGGTFFLPRLIGTQKAMALMMTGDKLLAKEAESMNLIFKSVEDDFFEEFVSTFTQKIATMPTRGLALTKKAVQEGWHNTIDQQLEVELKYQVMAGETNDFKEGVQSFLEKRSPKFVGN